MFKKICQKFVSVIILLVSSMSVFAAESDSASNNATTEQNNLIDLEGLRDPTAPLLMNMSQPQSSLLSFLSSYKVSSILIRANTKIAVINSRQVKEGDSLGNAEVISIDKTSVTLNIAGEEKILELYGRSIKTLNKDQQ